MPDSVPLNSDKLHRIIVAMTCIPYLDHADSSAVVVRFAYVVVPAFASSRIGSRSGDVRYDEFPGSSSAVFHRRALYSLPILHFCSRSYSSLVSRFFRVTCPIPLIHLLLYIYALVPFLPIACCLMFCKPRES